jgi:hypothetical protein
MLKQPKHEAVTRPSIGCVKQTNAISKPAHDRQQAAAGCTCWTSRLTRSTSSLMLLSCIISSRSCSHCDVSSFCLPLSPFSSLSRLLSRDAALLSLPAAFARLRRSMSSCRMRRSSSSSASGLLVISILSFAAASSMRSIALSGRKRSAMYLRAAPPRSAEC